MISSTSSKLANPFRTLDSKKPNLAFTGEIALGSHKMTKDYNNIQAESTKNPQVIEGSKLKLNLDIFNTITPKQQTIEKILPDKKTNEQAQTQPVFQNKLGGEINNRLSRPNNLNANQAQPEKPAKFFEEKTGNNLDLKAKNLTTEISALDKILQNKEKVRNQPQESEPIPVLNSASKPKNRVLQEIKTEDTGDAYLQMKMNSNNTAKTRKIIPSREKDPKKEEKTTKNEEKFPRIPPKIEEKPHKVDEKQPKIAVEPKKEPLKIEKTVNSKVHHPQTITKAAHPNNNQIKTDEAPDEEKLYECTEGCGRKFNAKALEKHVKICKKVFQTKPKEDNKEEEEKKTENNAGKKGKWQKQSEAFRAVVKAAKNQFSEKAEEEKPKPTEKKDNNIKKKGKK